MSPRVRAAGSSGPISNSRGSWAGWRRRSTTRHGTRRSPHSHGRTFAGEWWTFSGNMLSQVRLPQHRRAQVRALDEVKWAMRESGEEPSPENLAAKLDWSVDEVARVERETPRVSSLATRDHDDDGSLDSELPSDTPGPEQSLLRKQIADHLQECLGELDPVRSSRGGRPQARRPEAEGFRGAARLLHGTCQAAGTTRALEAARMPRSPRVHGSRNHRSRSERR